jgi:putative transposase
VIIVSHNTYYNIKISFSVQDLKEIIKDYSLQSKIFKRLLFINLRYSGRLVPEASEKIEITAATGYHWQERWNLNGYAG